LYVEKDSPPSSYAVAAALEKRPGAWGKVASGTLQRALFLAPGLALAGVRGDQLVKGAVLGSMGITVWLFFLYSLRRRGYVKVWAPAE
jgi:hypothetical protein